MDTRRPKRQKVANACVPCRSRKVKCDGIEPVCEPCQKRSVTCTWEVTASRATPQINPDAVKWLDGRLRMLENHGQQRPPTEAGGTRPGVGADITGPAVRAFDGQRISQTNSPDDPNYWSMASQHANAARSSPSNSRRQYETVTASAANQDPARHSGHSTSMRMDEVTPSDNHSVHAIIGATVDELQKEGFFGTSSAATFMQTVKRMVEQKLEGGQQEPTQAAPTSLARNHDAGLPLMIPSPEVVSKRVDYVLPSRKRADNLMTAYWDYVHTLYPYLDKRQMLEDYESLWTGYGPIADDRSFVCLLNIIFALASQIEDSAPPAEREGNSIVFYRRARELLDIEATASVRAVQSFLLLGKYFQSTSEPHPCWVFVGLATRTAQSLGLHLAETSERIADVRTRELLRRVWHGCILMDRVVSMTYGRPPMIGPRTAPAVPLPQSMPDEYLLPEEDWAVQQQHVETAIGKRRQQPQPSMIDFYVSSLKLFEILHDILFNLYSSTMQQSQSVDNLYDRYFGRHSLEENHPSVSGMDRELFHWAINLPAHLLPGGTYPLTQSGSIARRQATVLHQRHLHVRLLLLRPVLSTFISANFRELRGQSFLRMLSCRMSLQCAVVCVKVAQEVIETIHREQSDDVSEVASNANLSAWWYNVLFVYTAATVLIAARLSAAIITEIPEASILNSWSKAMEILERYGAFGTSIQRLSTTLRLLFDAVPQQYSRLRQQQQQPQQAESSDADPTTQSQDHAQPYWRLISPGGYLGSPGHDLSRDPVSEGGGDLPFGEVFPDFDAVFDPNDLSWLMTMPLNN